MSAQTEQAHVSVDDRRGRGVDAARQTPVSFHAEGPATAGRDAVGLLLEQNATREPDLVPVRHGRMMASPFTFYRGAAKVMAVDLAGTPSADLKVQLCGDAHLSNFGGFASPERQLVFGLNDFDETLPGPFEYDVKRMAASFTIAARNNAFNKADAHAVTVESVKAYRKAMTKFAEMRTLDVWYAHMSAQRFADAMQAFQEESPAVAGKSKDRGKIGNGKGKKHGKGGKRGPNSRPTDMIKQTGKAFKKARTRDSLQALGRFAEVVNGRYQIASQPPVVVPLREMEGSWGQSADQIRATVEDQFYAYQTSLSGDRRKLLERFRIVDVARKVVGVGSVGTRAWMVLLAGRDTHDPLFLQVKEATRSVLEDHLPESEFSTPGQRVVEGQRLLQATPDIFLGWTEGVQDDRFYYWRQLRDMKASAVVETMDPSRLTFYARMCGWTLALAHARSGDPVAIGAYLGGSDDFERAIARFSAGYADQNNSDYQAFVEAARGGRIDAQQGV